MHREPPDTAVVLTQLESAVTDWRNATAVQIAQALRDLRARTLLVFDAYAATGKLVVPLHDEYNPPLWELGHVGWFQEYWISRNLQRAAGIRCEPDHARAPSLLPQADSWYNSSTVPHAVRWSLPLLQPQACKDYLAATLEHTLALLATADASDDALYFYRLVMFHEAMHLEAALYMAQALGVPVNCLPDATHLIAACARIHWASGTISLQKTTWTLGSDCAGFAFDNELGAHQVEMDAFDIDSHCVRWQQYLHFVQATGRALPRYVRRNTGATEYEQQIFGVWQPLDTQAAAVHLNHHDVLAYCTWAGRRLPTEAEWEFAATRHGNAPVGTEHAAFVWGEVWEWTSSTFKAYPGFTAHPYRDYSQPWFDSRPVLRGACAATQPMMRSAKYRNYFMAQRSDIYAGFRTCEL